MAVAYREEDALVIVCALTRHTYRKTSKPSKGHVHVHVSIDWCRRRGRELNFVI